MPIFGYGMVVVGDQWTSADTPVSIVITPDGVEAPVTPAPH
jgi:hypothetical protein